jgi:tetratricopeptide (TPR) repeat protein
MIGVVLAGLSLIGPSTARGQPADPQRAAAAQVLYQQATAEMMEARYASACRKLEEVTRLVPEGLGAKLTLAQCYEALGQLASAWSHYALVAELAAKAGQKERARRAVAKATELRPKLATFAVEVPPEVRSIPGLSIERDGLVLGDGQWGVPIPVDAGPHEVTATAPGRKPWKQRAEVAANGAQVVVRVGALEDAVPAAEPERPWQRPVGIGAMALGGAGIVVGAVLGSLAIAKDAESEEGHCYAQGCDSEGARLSKEAVGLATASTAAVVAGSTLVAGGIIVFATSPRGPPGKSKSASAGWPSARFEVGLAGVSVTGAW